jgi:hypothetical protein
MGDRNPYYKFQYIHIITFFITHNENTEIINIYMFTTF